MNGENTTLAIGLANQLLTQGISLLQATQAASAQGRDITLEELQPFRDADAAAKADLEAAIKARGG